MAHSVSGYVLCVSMWFNTKFVRVPFLLKNLKIIFYKSLIFIFALKCRKNLKHYKYNTTFVFLSPFL